MTYLNAKSSPRLNALKIKGLKAALGNFVLLRREPRQGIENPYIQPYSGHERAQYLDIYSIDEAQKEYDKAMTKFPI